MLDIRLPRLPGGAAIVLRWLAGPGAALEAGAPLLIVRTEVAEVALPVPEAGDLAEVLLDAGQRAEPGQALARMHPAGQPARPAPRRATPLARRIALAHGVDLAALAGSGDHGRVVAEDVRRVVGANRSQANDSPRQIPIATAMIEFDAGAALALCAAQGASLSACVAAAAAGLLPGHRALNSSWAGDGLLLRRRVCLAVATPVCAGLSWALIRDAGDLTLRGVARALRAEAAPPDLSEASFALVSLAEGAIWQSAPPPLAGTVAALGLGAPRGQAVARGDTIAMRPIAALALSYDARAADHAQAAAFLRDLRDALERL